jgi:hypothetical protein
VQTGRCRRGGNEKLDHGGVQLELDGARDLRACDNRDHVVAGDPDDPELVVVEVSPGDRARKRVAAQDWSERDLVVHAVGEYGLLEGRRAGRD